MKTWKLVGIPKTFSTADTLLRPAWFFPSFSFVLITNLSLHFHAVCRHSRMNHNKDISHIVSVDWRNLGLFVNIYLFFSLILSPNKRGGRTHDIAFPLSTCDQLYSFEILTFWNEQGWPFAFGEKNVGFLQPQSALFFDCNAVYWYIVPEIILDLACASCNPCFMLCAGWPQPCQSWMVA